MLIASPRHRPEDLKAWEDQSRYDGRLWPTVARKAKRAERVIKKFSAPGSGYIGVSWGKDSTVVAHLAIEAHSPLPLVWVRVRQWENPDCEAVRDAFLHQYPDTRYEEIVVDSAAPRRWEASQGTKRTSKGGFDTAAARYGARHISGVRAQESTTRRLTVQRNGESSATTARPIATWSATDVFTYLHTHDLPIHPAYAMNMAGALHRDNIRVGSLGGERGTGMGRAEWERKYYGDIVH